MNSSRYFGAIAALCALLGMSACSKTADIDKLSKSAAALESEGKYPAAIIELKNILQSAPNYAPARLAMGRVYLQLGDSKNANIELNKTLSLLPDDPQALTLRYRAHLLDGKYKQVVEALENAAGHSAKLGPEITATLLGRAQMGLGQLEAAGLNANKALQINPSNTEAKLLLAQLDATGGKTDAAASKIDAVLASAPNNPDALLQKGELQLHLKQIDRATATFEKLTKAAPHSVLGYLGLANARLLADDAVGAEKAARQAGKVVPHSSSASYFFAYAIYKQGRIDEALTTLYNLIKVYPGHPQCHLLAAEILLDKGQVNQAEDILLPTVTRYPGYLPTTLLLAMVQLRQGHAADVVNRLQPIAATGVREPQVYTLLGNAYLQLKDFQNASRLLDKAAQFIEVPADADVFRARSNLAVGKADEAVNDLQKALTANPDLVQAEALLIMVYLQRGELDKALEGAIKQTAKHPDRPQAQELLARVHEAAGRAAEARASYEKTLAIDPTYIPAALRLAELDFTAGNLAAVNARLEALLKLKLPAAGHAAVLLSQASIARRQKGLGADEALLKAALEQAPGNADALMGLAQIASRAGDFDKVGSLLETARRMNTGDFRPRTLLARHYITRQNFATALEVAKEAQALAPQNLDVLYTLGEAYRGVGQNDDALQIYQQAVALGARDVDTLLSLATTASRAGKNAESTASFKQAIDTVYTQLMVGMEQAKPESSHIIALGRIELLRGKPAQARQFAARVVALYPALPDSYDFSGDALLASDESNAAAPAAMYKKALALGAGRQTVAKLAGLYALKGNGDGKQVITTWLAKHPDDAPLRNQLAEMLLTAGDKGGAIAELEKIAALEPQNALALNNLAALYQEQSDARALATAERAAALAPGNLWIADTYGWILVSRNSLEKGLTLLRQAADGLPDEPTVLYHFASALAASGNVKDARTVLDRALTSPKDFPEKAAAQRLAEDLKP